MSIVAVITGDVNASERMGQAHKKRLEQVLSSSFQDMVVALDKCQIDHFTCFRGDAWQFVVKTPAKAVDAALFFRASLLVQSQEVFGKKQHTSVAIGFGEVDFFPDDISAAGGGDAYRLSGHKLDKLRKRMPGMGVSGLGKNDVGIDAVLGVLDALVRQWTALQAKAVCLALKGLLQEEIAKEWEPRPITQQAVQKHLYAAGWPGIEPALEWVYTILEGCIVDNNLVGL